MLRLFLKFLKNPIKFIRFSLIPKIGNNFLYLNYCKKNSTQENEFIKNHPNIHFCEDTPLMKISSSYIREAIRKGQDVRYLLTEAVFNYVDEMNFYK